MLTCRACLRRCIRALDAPASQSYLLRHDLQSALFRGQRRSLRTAVRKVETRPSTLVEVEKLSRTKEEPWKKSPEAAAQKRRQRAALKRKPSTAENGKEGGLSSMWLGRQDPNMSAADWQRRKRELQYLRDPLELANFVKQELRKNKSTEMLQLVRMASHSMQCIVSWNHIIDHLLAKERVTEALKVYNEMKKRAQFPDSYTYTILLRGLSINAHRPGALSKALTIYYSMSAPNSRVEPTIIHTNAVLRVCARALDMDALWGIAAKIPETGPASANPVTYTTILNALRQSLLVNVPTGETEEEVAARRERGIVEGRRVWEEVISKWRNADLVVEEELVCAMGRLLLIGSRPKDWDDVLSLVEQTMDVPRLIPRLGTVAREEAGLPHLRAPNTPEQYRFNDDHLTPTKGPVRGDEFLPVTARGVSNPLKYATPSNDTLSVIQEACQKIVAVQAAEDYWNLLTDTSTYGIAPDNNNLHSRLRILRQNRASGKALQLLQEDFIAKGVELKPGTFRLAMSTCVRDKNNHNSLKHANQILHLMMTLLPDADAKATMMYAELALTFPLAKGEDIVLALTYLQPVIKSLRIQLGIGAERRYGNGVGAVYLTGAARQDAIAALRKIHGVYDKLINSNLISEEQKAPFKAERARLTAFINRVIFKDSNRKWELARETLSVEAGKPSEEESSEDKENKSGGWRARNALPAGRRRPWSSSPTANIVA